MLCSLVDIVPAGSNPDRAGVWSKEAVDSFASMIGNKAMLLTVNVKMLNVQAIIVRDSR